MKEIKKIFMSLLTVLMMLSIGVINPIKVHAVEIGDVWVNGKNLVYSPDNTVSCDRGTAVYDPTNETLTLDNAVLNRGNNMSRVIDVKTGVPLTIILIGNNMIDVSDMVPVFASGDLTFSGTGSLTVSSNQEGIFSSGNVIIDGTTITSTSTGINAIYSDDTVIIKNGAKVTSKGFESGFQVTNALEISNSTVIAESTDAVQNAIYILDGSLSIKDEANVTATGSTTAVWAKTNISIENSTVSAASTGGVGIWTPASFTITGESDVTAIGAKGSLGGGTSATITPAKDKSLDILVGEDEGNASLVDGAPFLEETDLIALNVKSKLYFHSKAHSHIPATTWSKDTTNHWHECTASDGEKSEVAPHTFGEWVIDTPATETAKGSKHRECTVCKQEETAEIPVIIVTPEKPVITAGAGSTHQISNDKDMTLTCSGKLEDLIGVYVDGKLVDESNYTLKSGSTILTLKVNYLDTLSVGKHTLKFEYKDNLSAETDFTITAKETPKNDSVIKETAFPKTSDNSNLVIFAFLLLLSGCAVGTVTYKRKKSINN